jgi:hypothetical protein
MITSEQLFQSALIKIKIFRSLTISLNSNELNGRSFQINSFMNTKRSTQVSFDNNINLNYLNEKVFKFDINIDEKLLSLPTAIIWFVIIVKKLSKYWSF